MTNASSHLKQQAAEAALAYIGNGNIIGVGTGSTVNYFIEALAPYKHKIEGAVASSVATAEKLKAANIPLVDLNSLDHLPIYIDGADAIDTHLRMLKGGGGAMTREKIVAAVAKKFICIADDSKLQTPLNTTHTPLPVEVLPMARSYVARQLVKLGATPIYRQGFITDNGNIILDVFNIDLQNMIALDDTLNNITGVVGHGLFVKRPADVLLLATTQGVQEIKAI